MSVQFAYTGTTSRSVCIESKNLSKNSPCRPSFAESIQRQRH